MSEYKTQWIDTGCPIRQGRPNYHPSNVLFVSDAVAKAALSMDGDMDDNILRIYRSDLFRENFDDRWPIVVLQSIWTTDGFAERILRSLGSANALRWADPDEWDLATMKTYFIEYQRVMSRMSGRQIADLYDTRQVLSVFMWWAHLTGCLYTDEAEDYQCDYFQHYPESLKLCMDAIEHIGICTSIGGILFKAMLSIGGDLRKAMTELLRSSRFRERFLNVPIKELSDLDEDKEARSLLDDLGYDVPLVTDLDSAYDWVNFGHHIAGICLSTDDAAVDVIDFINSNFTNRYWKTIQDIFDRRPTEVNHVYACW